MCQTLLQAPTAFRTMADCHLGVPSTLDVLRCAFLYLTSEAFTMALRFGLYTLWTCRIKQRRPLQGSRQSGRQRCRQPRRA